MANVEVRPTHKNPQTKSIAEMNLKQTNQYEIDLWATYRHLRVDQTQDLARCLRLISRVQLKIKELSNAKM